MEPHACRLVPVRVAFAHGRVRAVTGLLLDGITALEQAVAAPFATRQLADLGARVINVERPGGDVARGYARVVNSKSGADSGSGVDGESSAFVRLNRGKESVQIDLKEPAGRDVLHRLLDRADVLVADLAPGVMARLELTAAALADLDPIDGPEDGPEGER